jgi:hypothetical protein
MMQNAGHEYPHCLLCGEVRARHATGIFCRKLWRIALQKTLYSYLEPGHGDARIQSTLPHQLSQTCPSDSRRIKRVPSLPPKIVLSFAEYFFRGYAMAASQVVLYFDKQEDAVMFTLAASSVLSAEEPSREKEALARIAGEICKASRITTEGALKAAE